MFVITVTYEPSAAAADARSEAAGDAVTSSRPSDNADEPAPPAPAGLAGRKMCRLSYILDPPAYVTVITNTSTKLLEKITELLRSSVEQNG